MAMKPLSRTNKKGQLVFRLRVKINGREYTRTWPDKNEPPIPEGWSYKKALKEAERAAIMFENECRGGLTSTDKRTFADYAQYIVEYKLSTGNIKPKTADGYKYLLQRIRASKIGAMKVADIQARNLNEFYKSLLSDGQNKKTGGKLSTKTIREYHAFISSVLTQATKEGIAFRNVADLATPPKVIRKEAKCYTLEEEKNILSVVQNEPGYWRAMTYVFIFSGARRSEVAGLQWTDIDFENNTIRIRQAITYISGEGLHIGTPKTGKENTIPMPVEVMNELQAWKTEQERIQGVISISGFVFSINSPDTPIHPDSITTYYRRLGKLCGMEDGIHPHGFRHTHASMILQSGDIVAASKRLGHSKTSTTMDIYGHMMPHRDKVMSDFVAAKFFKTRSGVE